MNTEPEFQNDRNSDMPGTPLRREPGGPEQHMPPGKPDRKSKGARNLIDLIVGLVVGILPCGLFCVGLFQVRSIDKVDDYLAAFLVPLAFAALISIVAAIVSFFIRRPFFGIGVIVAYGLIPLLLFGSCFFLISIS